MIQLMTGFCMHSFHSYGGSALIVFTSSSKFHFICSISLYMKGDQAIQQFIRENKGQMVIYIYIKEEKRNEQDNHIFGEVWLRAHALIGGENLSMIVPSLLKL